MEKHSKSIIGKKIHFGVTVISYVVLEKQIVKQSENILRNKAEKYLNKLLDSKTDMSIIDIKRRNTMKECITDKGHSFEPRYSETTGPDIEGLKQILNKIIETNFMGDQ
jgi:adenylate cyclase